jgi:hypothetical protein
MPLLAPFAMPDPVAAGKASGHARKSGPILQILAMQAKLFARVVDEQTDPKEAASCACAWQKLEAQKLILKGKPLPGSLRPTAAPKRAKRSAASPVEPGGNARPIAEQVKPEPVE